MKCDLHIHSRHSDRAADWLFRKLEFPDSYTDPKLIYHRLREMGMDFVTLTDHDRITGCLEFADQPGTFISEEVTAVFPEDRCQVHLLVWGIDEATHAMIQELRENIYELQRFLSEGAIAHAVAHPLYNLGDRLTPAHVEKLMLLFKNFEGLNGLRDALLSEVGRFVLERLTPEIIDELANKHGIAPTHPEPWKKFFTAGSDDHGGMFPGSAWTETQVYCGNAKEFLWHVRAGHCEARGKGGTPLVVAHGLYNTIHKFIGAKFAKGNTSEFLERAFSRFMEGRNPTEFTLAEKLGFIAQGIASGQIFELAKPQNASVWRQFASYFARTNIKSLVEKETAGVQEPERRAFLMANLFSNQLAFRFFTRFVDDISSGRVIESIQDVATFAPIALALSPYIYAFQSQSPSRDWLRDVATTTAGHAPDCVQNHKRAWFTDTLEDVNGVATTIRKMAGAAVEEGKDLVVVTSRQQILISGIPIKNFKPIGEFELPEYELQKLSFPPILQMIDYIQREKFTEVIISTPGPIGVTALLAAKMLKLRTSGIYHTDFPQYVRILTDDNFLETLAWNYMWWFYSQLDLIFVNSEYYRQAWIDRGIPAEKLRIFPRGLDLDLFNPDRRNESLRHKWGVPDGRAVLLYVGRVSKEKDLDVLAESYASLKDTAHFVIVGDGPYVADLKERMPEANFTGYLIGADLAAAYASADIFVFPSTTDTFGNVVLEAMACGLPGVVSDMGGPRELVDDGQTGFITRSLDAAAFTAATKVLIDDEPLRRKMSANACQAVLNRNWSNAFRRFWAMSRE